jgi:hypothetical protein
MGKFAVIICLSFSLIYGSVLVVGFKQKNGAMSFDLFLPGASNHFSETLPEKVYGFSRFLFSRLYLDSGTGSAVTTLSCCCGNCGSDSVCGSFSTSESIHGLVSVVMEGHRMSERLVECHLE